MNTRESFRNLLYVEQEHVEEQELSAFTSAVTEMFGAEQARLSERDWLDESDLPDSPPLSAGRNWGAVTIAASARLASRVPEALNQATPAPSEATKVSPIPSCEVPVRHFCCDVPIASGVGWTGERA